MAVGNVSHNASLFGALPSSPTPFDEYCDEDNFTIAPPLSLPGGVSAEQVVIVTSYVLICLCGLLGNGLVIYVVLRYTKMKTVTNLYILNLAISDVLFLISLPFLITTTLLQYWVFGQAMCKIYFVLYSINFFTSVFTLMAMSADRYLAICHPVRSVGHRTPRIAFFVCLCIWSISFLVMLPIILYSTTLPNKMRNNKDTCTIVWPDGQLIPPEKAFTWYTFLLGFAIPVSLISVFYVSVIIRLNTVGPVIKSKQKKKSHRKVTQMVLTVISVYVICWLPHWIFQVDLTFKPKGILLMHWEVFLFNVFTVLTFANSMLNPLLYAFLSENFRKSFMKAFKCATITEVNKSLCVENSVFPRHQSTQRGMNGRDNTEKFEFTTMLTTAEVPLNNANNVSTEICDEQSALYVDKESQTTKDGVQD